MKKNIQSIKLLGLLMVVVSSYAQSNIHIDESLLIAGNYVALTDNRVTGPDYSEPSEAEEHTIKPGGIIVGTVLMSGGIAAGIAGQLLGKKAYSKYLRSAFTDNTDRLHKRVVRYNIMRVAGGVCAGAGIFTLIFSF